MKITLATKISYHALFIHGKLQQTWALFTPWANFNESLQKTIDKIYEKPFDERSWMKLMFPKFQENSQAFEEPFKTFFAILETCNLLVVRESSPTFNKGPSLGSFGEDS